MELRGFITIGHTAFQNEEYNFAEICFREVIARATSLHFEEAHLERQKRAMMTSVYINLFVIKCHQVIKNGHLLKAYIYFDLRTYIYEHGSIPFKQMGWV